MDERVATAFKSAAERTFRDMFGIEAKMIDMAELSPSDEHGWELTGLVGLAGQAHGVAAVRLASALVERLLSGTGVDASSEQERRQLEGGLVGEMINIIAGQAASSLSGIDMEIAPPVVVRGPNHKIGWPSIAPVVALSFSLPGGSLELDLCVKL